MERFNQKFKKVKRNGFPIVFSNLALRGVILEIPYGCFRDFSPFLPKKHRLGVFFFRFEDGPFKLIPYYNVNVYNLSRILKCSFIILKI